ncbi:serine hydrolase [Deinococcus hopiensis]|uniref:serine hydrolase n=1 Tax=Deinococcus hopiensis TaxID=309885 RepID=UPI001481D9D2|nr:serine hydrolase [Deinococcus hopiensis]
MLKVTLAFLTPTPVPDLAATHTVHTADTLYHLAQTSHTTAAELQRLNNLTQPGLHIGQTLVLPRRPRSPSLRRPHSPQRRRRPLLRRLPGVAIPSRPPTFHLRPFVTGDVSFYIAVYDPKTLIAQRAYATGGANTLYPLASTFKTPVVRAALRDVDAERLSLNTPPTTTTANRSLESYSSGTHPLSYLLDRMISKSENTAADIVFRTVGPERVAQQVHALSPCTSILITTKAWRSIQGGMLPAQNRSTLLNAAQVYQALPWEQRVAFASKLNAASLRVQAPQLSHQLDAYFAGPNYDPRLDVAVQNSSTAHAYADLLAQLLSRPGRTPGRAAQLRNFYAPGCCHPGTDRVTEKPAVPVTYWGSKGGIGWGNLNLTGFIQLVDGRILTYTYFNHGSQVKDALAIRPRIFKLVPWINSLPPSLTR